LGNLGEIELPFYWGNLGEFSLSISGHINVVEIILRNN
jgi:hypothetical protein